MTTPNPASIDSIKKKLQDHFKDGLTIIIGSGLSCAEGLPGMRKLAEYLSNELPTRILESDKTLWAEIEPKLFTDGLEKALVNPISETLEKEIILLVSSYLIEHEQRVVEEVLLGKRQLRLTKLLSHILIDKYIPIITTNYDRLVEIAVEEAGYGVDTLFVGKFISKLDPQKSQLTFCEDVIQSPKKRSATLKYKKRAIICKPHESLDWYFRDNTPISFNSHVPNLDRLIIVPGQNKFRSGYNIPFDIHREKANFYIDNATRFLIIGYGFNDEHLETHLKSHNALSKPTVMLTHTLSPNAMVIAQNCSNVIAIDCYNEGCTTGTRIILDKHIYYFPDINLWDIESFILEVFKP